MYFFDISSDMNHTDLHTQMRAGLLDSQFASPSLQLPHMYLLNVGEGKASPAT